MCASKSSAEWVKCVRQWINERESVTMQQTSGTSSTLFCRRFRLITLFLSHSLSVFTALSHYTFRCTNIKYFALTCIDHRINYTNMPVIIAIWICAATKTIIAGQINTYTHSNSTRQDQSLTKQKISINTLTAYVYIYTLSNTTVKLA